MSNKFNLHQLLESKFLLGICLIFALFSVRTKADVAADVETNILESVNNQTQTLGWEFSPAVDIEVTSLGLFDAGSDGLEDAHEIGLWTEDRNLLATANMPAGTGTTKIGNFRYIEISPVELKTGITYVIGALYLGIQGGGLLDQSPLTRDWFLGSFSFLNNGIVKTFAHEIIFGDGRQSSQQISGLRFPIDMNPDITEAILGPSFMFEVKGKTPTVFLRCPGDVNSDGTQDITTLVSDVGTNRLTATIRDVTGKLINQVNFDGLLHPVDMEVMTDINANDASELVVLGKAQGSVQAEVRDSLTGALLGTVDFGPDVKPFDLEIVPDQNGNGIPELAVLGENPVQAEVRDALTGNLLNTLSYTNNVTPKDLLILPDSNGKGGPEMGVLGEHDDPNKSDRVEIRDLLTGKWVRSVYYGKITANKAQLVPDLNNNGTPEIAVLDTSNDKVTVLVKDSVTRAPVGYFGYDPNYAPGKLLVVPDVNGNGASEITVFGKNSNNRTQKALVRDGKTKKRIRNVFFNKAFEPDDLVVIPDINDNGASEIGMLGTRPDNGLMRLIIKDSKSGTLVGTVNF